MEFTNKYISNYLKALASQIEKGEIKAQTVELDNTYYSKQVLINYNEIDKEESDND